MPWFPRTWRRSLAVNKCASWSSRYKTITSHVKTPSLSLNIYRWTITSNVMILLICSSCYTLTTLDPLLCNTHQDVIIHEYRLWLQLDVDLISMPTFIFLFCCWHPWSSLPPFHFLVSNWYIQQLMVQYSHYPGEFHLLWLHWSYFVHWYSPYCPRFSLEVISCYKAF